MTQTNKLPAMPLWVDDFLKDTSKRTLLEKGAYLVLLMEMWKEGGSIAHRDEDIAPRLGISVREWMKLKPRLMDFLFVYGPPDAEMLSQKRLQKEWNYVQDVRARMSAKGKQGASGRWQKQKAVDAVLDGLGNGTGNASATGVGNGTADGPGYGATDSTFKTEYLTRTSQNKSHGENAEVANDPGPIPEGLAREPPTPGRHLLTSLEKLEREKPFLPRTRHHRTA
jgi:uncharacterized protein YdaU (DUF1376 family)